MSVKKLKVASFIGLSHLSKLFVHLFIIKQIAVLHGPEGLGFLGNFMTLMALATTLSGGGIVSGIIKYVSEFAGNNNRQRNFIGSAFVYTIVSSLIILIIGFLFSTGFTNYVFLNQKFKIYIYFFLVMQVFVAINNFAFGVCNGFRKTELYAFFSIVGNIIAFVFSYFAIPHFGFLGAIFSIAAPAFCAFIPLVIYVGIKKVSFSHYIKFASLKADSCLLSRYSLMLICSAICFPVVEMMIRNMIVNFSDLNTSGYWLAITRFSSAYLSFYSLFLSFYFVPIISAANDKMFIFRQVKTMALFIIILFTLMLFFFCLFRNNIILVVFSSDFLPVSNLFLLQMVGDLFRVVGWVIGFVIVAKALSRLYILSEIVQAGLFIALSSIQLSYGRGVEGVVYAYLGTCILYCVLSFIIFYCLFRGTQLECIEANN